MTSRDRTSGFNHRFITLIRTRPMTLAHAARIGAAAGIAAALGFAAAPAFAVPPTPQDSSLQWVTSPTFTENRPSALLHADVLQGLSALPRSFAPPVDLARVTREDAAAESLGLPRRFAIANRVSIDPKTSGLWENLGTGTRVWRMRVTSTGARSLNLGFTRYEMPEGGRLMIYSSGMERIVRPFTAADNNDAHELWTPVIAADDIVVEVTVPSDRADLLKLSLSYINVGYRGFGSPDVIESGSCNLDIVCPGGDPWRREIQSVANLQRNGSILCTGFMMNNTAQNQTPYFQTANHCGVTSGNASTVVAYWNYETTVCGGTPNGSLSMFTTGSTFKAASSPSDFTLVQLNAMPNPLWSVTYGGWDRTGADALNATAIHQPNNDEKRISFELQPTTTTSYLGTSVPGDGTHVRITDWDTGTTEPGSSGSPLFDQNHHVIGQLHGGFAACGNNSSDWYGKFSVSWTGGGTNTTRLSNWLDPLGANPPSQDTFMPASADCNANGVPDHQDILVGTALDCQGNLAPDSCDIANGTSLDTNSNGIPDECENTIPCADVANFQARCRTGSVQARATFTSATHSGQTITIGVDATSVNATIAGTFGQTIVPGQSTGTHTVSLQSPSGCVAPIIVNCP